jgi:anti-sigma factor RsiW
MKHHDFWLLISPYVDGELPPKVRFEVENHISLCAQCRRHVAELELLGEDIKRSADISLRQNFAWDVLRTVRKKEESTKTWNPILFVARRTVVALAIVVLVLLGLTSFNAGRSSISVEQYLAGEVSSSAESQILFNRDEISKEDVLMAAVSRQ